MAEAVRKKAVRQSRESRTSSILSAAREVFEEQGYDNATMSDIAKRVGVVEGTVFHYFASKQALVTALMEQFYADITNSQMEGLQGIAGTYNRLRYVIWHHAKMMHDNAKFCAVLLRESRSFDGDLRVAVTERNRYYTGCLNIVIKEGLASGDISAGTSVKLVSNAVYGNVEHALWDFVRDGKPMRVDKLANELSEMIWRGIAQSPRSEMENKVDKDEIAALVKKLNHLLN